MLYAGKNYYLRFATRWLAVVAVLLTGAPGIKARQTAPADKQVTSVTPVASTGRVEYLLPDVLAGYKSTEGLKLAGADKLSEFVADKAPVYEEYLVGTVASREYGGARVDVFETRSQFAAFGLFTYVTGTNDTRPATSSIGSGSARIEGAVVFWKSNFFVRVNAGQKPARYILFETLARAVAESIIPRTANILEPPLVASLPAGSLVAGSRRYFLGPESLNAYAEHARELFDFAGDTEAVIGEYVQRPAPEGARITAGPDSDAAATDSALKLVIVESHTPQFATDAMARATGFVSTLPEEEQNHIIIKRTGNYIVAALHVQDREFAQSLIDSIEYPYTVKWLRNPLWATNDPFHAQKAAEMLLSTFGLLGIILLTVLAGGTAFGTTIFLKRRKRQREIFSDAGGMLRLDLDPFESAILGLPPKRSDE